MLPLILRTIVFLIISVSMIFAHEEPPKTLKEKQEKDREKRRIADQGIQFTEIWRTDYDSAGQSKARYLYQKIEYRPDGAMVSVTQYRSEGSVQMQVRYDYDAHGNMITDADFDSSGRCLEKVIYRYDDSGRVTGSLNYKGDDLDSRFEYHRNPLSSTVEFYKFNSRDSLEYRIDYVYTPPLDHGHLIRIFKYIPNGDTTVYVEYRYDKNSQVSEKIIYGEKRRLSHRFLYEYDDNGHRRQIRKILPGEKTEWIQQFRYDAQGNLLIIHVKDAEQRTKYVLDYRVVKNN